MKELKILSVNTSEKKGTVKKPVDKIILFPLGITGDAHAGDWNRQVSLLGVESIGKMEGTAGRKFKYGEFAENVTTQGFALNTMHPLDKLISGDVVLEVTQIGKVCHDRCAIFEQAGDCVMPREGIFARVLAGGTIEQGDRVEVESRPDDKEHSRA